MIRGPRRLSCDTNRAAVQKMGSCSAHLSGQQLKMYSKDSISVPRYVIPAPASFLFCDNVRADLQTMDAHSCSKVWDRLEWHRSTLKVFASLSKNGEELKPLLHHLPRSIPLHSWLSRCCATSWNLVALLLAHGYNLSERNVQTLEMILHSRSGQSLHAIPWLHRFLCVAIDDENGCNLMTAAAQKSYSESHAFSELKRRWVPQPMTESTMHIPCGIFRIDLYCQISWLLPSTQPAPKSDWSAI